MHFRTWVMAAAASLCACSWLHLPGGPRALAPGEAERICSRAEVRRQGDADLRSLLAAGDAAVRARAAVAAGRVRDREAVPALAKLLQDEKTAEAGAWALGRIDGGEGPLLRCVNSARCPAAAAAARALGAPGRHKLAVETLARALFARPEIAAGAAVSLALIARLGSKREKADVTDTAGAELLRALARPEPEVRRGAAMALGRLAPRDPPPELPTAIVAALHDESAEVRLHAAGAATRLAAKPSDLAHLLRDRDWRVRVEGARALAVTPGSAAVITAALPDVIDLADARDPADAKWAHALAALLDAAGRAGGAARMAIGPPASFHAPTPASTAAVRCAAAAARDRAIGWVEETRSCGAGIEPEWRSRLRSGLLAVELGEKPDSPARPAALGALTDTDPRVRAQTASAANAIAFADALARMLEDNDPYVVSEAASTLAKEPSAALAALPYAVRAVKRFRKDDTAPAGAAAVDALIALAQLGASAKKTEPPPMPGELLELFSGMVPASPPLHRALAETLAAMGGPALGTPPEPAVPADAERGLPGNGPRPRALVISTSAGELVVKLHSADGEAPLTSAALAALAERKFYDGLSWHRVVPDFVIQGGDPRGDGDGGPGWALPDEHSPMRFRRGTLGIATSGPETGGSQIFLCHSSQPHLDGRYTVAGDLLSGEDTLDAIHVGDTILSVKVE